MTFDPPASIDQDRSQPVHLRLSALTLAADPSSGPRPTTREDAVSISTSISAEIRGSDFAIEELSSRVQTVGAGVTEWRWRISTTSSGPQTIHLLVTAYATSEGNAVAGRDVVAVDCTYDVPVNPAFVAGHFLTEQWQWLVGALLIPLIGFGGRALTRKRANGASDTPER